MSFEWMNSGWLFFAGCALLTMILLKRTFRRLGRRRTKKNEPAIERIARPASKWDGAQRDSLAIIERQKVEMYEMERDLSGQLNSKIVVLEQLVGESQQQIERLETLLAEAKQEVVEAKGEVVKSR